MKITRIHVHRVDLPITGGYRLSGDRRYDILDSTVIIVETDSDLRGIGESCPLGSDYIPAFSPGARAAIAEMAPALIGEDPRRLGRVNAVMDATLRGHGYAKSAIDMACWDLLGKATGMPVYDLMGGRLTDRVPLRIGTATAPPSEMGDSVARRKREGYDRFSAKVGDEPGDDIARLRAMAEQMDDGDVLVADANGGWRQHEAIRVAAALRDAPGLYLEQPCATYEECLAVRQVVTQPIILDECLVDLATLVRAHADNAADGVNLKIGRVGGLTKARLLRDACCELGWALHVQDSWGSAVVAAAIGHLAHSTPGDLLLGAWDPTGWTDLETATGAPEVREGAMIASDRAGLGIEPAENAIGAPVATIEE